MIDPIIFRIGFIQVGYYALVYILGFLAALFVLMYFRKEIGLKDGEVYDFVLLLVVGALVGSRLFHVLFWGWDYFSVHLNEVVRIWEGGMSFHGGLMGAFLVSWFYCKMKKIDFWRLTDIVVLPSSLFLAIGRIANYINQEIVGSLTSVSWCVEFSNVDGCRHPIQLYAAFGRFVLFGFLLFLSKKLGEFKSGFIFWNFVFWICFGRFLLDFWRPDIRYSFLIAGQWLSLVLVAIAGIVLWKDYKKDAIRLWKCL